jgi:hypothetical protein
LPVTSRVVADPQQPAPDPESDAPAECVPCRGTGSVLSFLGGETTSVTCPWCEGSGTRRAGVDAQARWLPSEASADRDGQAVESGVAQG